MRASVTLCGEMKSSPSDAAPQATFLKAEARAPRLEETAAGTQKS